MKGRWVSKVQLLYASSSSEILRLFFLEFGKDSNFSSSIKFSVKLKSSLHEENLKRKSLPKLSFTKLALTLSKPKC